MLDAARSDAAEVLTGAPGGGLARAAVEVAFARGEAFGGLLLLLTALDRGAGAGSWRLSGHWWHPRRPRAPSS